MEVLSLFPRSLLKAQLSESMLGRLQTLGKKFSRI